MSIAAIVCASLVYALFAFVWMKNNEAPDLTPKKAAKTISARPEFNRTRQLVGVMDVKRPTDSLHDCCSSAQFTFRRRGSETVIAAYASFRYWQHGWHLQDFSTPDPKFETVVITSDSPPEP